MKKILYIHHGGGLGGAPKSLAFLIEKIDRTKYYPIVLMTNDGPAKELFKEVGAEVIIEPRLGVFHGTTVTGMSFQLFMFNLIYLLPTKFLGKKIIESIKPDLIHLNTTCLFQYAKISKKIKMDIPVITHVREPLLDNIFGKILKVMNHRYVDAYIAIEKYDLSKMNTDSKISKVIYNFVDFTKYDSDIKSDILREELSLKKEDVVFVYLARIDKSNGALQMVKAINNLCKNKDFHFVMIGANEIKSEYEKKVEKECKNNPNIHLLNFRRDIPEVLASSDVNISPFVEPHFSRSVIEAAAMQVPSIISNVSGLTELVIDGKTGYVFDIRNQSDFIEKINLLGGNPILRRELGVNSKIRAENLFEANINAKRTFDVYDLLL